MKVIIALLAVALLTGCNDVSRGFRPVVNLQEAAKSDTLEFADGEPQMRDGTKDTRADMQEARREGWMMLGYSVFPENPTLQQQLRDKARELKAGLVILSVLGTQQTNSMMAVPSGTSTMFVPIAGVSRTYGASFWVKEKLSSIGFYGRNLTQEEAIKRGDGNGMFVAVVSRGYGADRAGLREGDIVTHIAGKEVINTLDAMDIIQRSTLAEIDLKVQRDGKPLGMTMETGRQVE